MTEEGNRCTTVGVLWIVESWSGWKVSRRKAHGEEPFNRRQRALCPFLTPESTNRHMLIALRRHDTETRKGLVGLFSKSRRGRRNQVLPAMFKWGWAFFPREWKRRTVHSRSEDWLWEVGHRQQVLFPALLHAVIAEHRSWSNYPNELCGIHNRTISWPIITIFSWGVEIFRQKRVSERWWKWNFKWKGGDKGVENGVWLSFLSGRSKPLSQSMAKIQLGAFKKAILACLLNFVLLTYIFEMRMSRLKWI